MNNMDDIKIEPQYDGDGDDIYVDLWMTPITDKGKAALDQLVKEDLAKVDKSGSYLINNSDLDVGISDLGDQGIKVSGVYESWNDGKIETFADGAGMSDYGVAYGGGYDLLRETFYRKETV
jgi:hypothetical protein